MARIGSPKGQAAVLGLGDQVDGVKIYTRTASLTDDWRNMQVEDTSRQEYEIEFSDKQWDEICCMSFEPFTFGPEIPMTRGQWWAIGEMALGKAQRIEEGAYGGDEGDGFDPETRSEELRAIAATIFEKFQPGDGQF